MVWQKFRHLNVYPLWILFTNLAGTGGRPLQIRIECGWPMTSPFGTKPSQMVPWWIISQGALNLQALPILLTVYPSTSTLNPKRQICLNRCAARAAQLAQARALKSHKRQLQEKLRQGSNDRVWWQTIKSISGICTSSIKSSPDVEDLGKFFASKFTLRDGFEESQLDTTESK